jgi:hypothetical protein
MVDRRSTTVVPIRLPERAGHRAADTGPMSSDEIIARAATTAILSGRVSVLSSLLLDRWLAAERRRDGLLRGSPEYARAEAACEQAADAYRRSVG